MRTAKRNYLSVPVLLLIITAILVSFPSAKKAYATGSIVQATGYTGVCTSTCSVAFLNPVTSGNFIIGFAQANPNGAFCNTVSTFTDTLGFSYTAATNFCQGGGDLASFIYIAQATSSGSDTLSVTFGGTVFANGGSIQAFEITGAPSFNFLASGGGSTSSTAASTQNSITLPASYFEISAIITGTSTCSTAQGGQTQYAFGVANCWFVGGAGTGSTSFAYGIEPHVTSPTAFAWTAAQADWSLVGIVFAPSVTINSLLTVPCTAFELQCWLYPMFVFGIYMVLILGMARAVNVPTQDYTGHLMEAFSLASLVMIIFGILNIMPALIITVFQIVRAIRE